MSGAQPDAGTGVDPVEDGAREEIWVREMAPGEADLVEERRLASMEEGRRYRGGERLAVADGTSVDSRGEPAGTTGETVTLMAVFRSSVIGVLRAHQRNRAEWTVDFVHVLPEARGAGAGDALMDELIERLRARGVGWLGARALPGDRETKNLYERHGMSAKLIEVGVDLGSVTRNE